MSNEERADAEPCGRCTFDYEDFASANGLDYRAWHDRVNIYCPGYITTAELREQIARKIAKRLHAQEPDAFDEYEIADIFYLEIAEDCLAVFRGSERGAE